MSANIRRLVILFVGSLVVAGFMALDAEAKGRGGRGHRPHRAGRGHRPHGHRPHRAARPGRRPHRLAHRPHRPARPGRRPAKLALERIKTGKGDQPRKTVKAPR